MELLPRLETADSLGSPRALRVALVDDDAMQRRHLAALLHRWSEVARVHWSILEFSSGHALSDTYPGDIDLIMADVAMPGIDGFEMARRIRAIDTEVTIVFVTNMANTAVYGYEVGALGFLVKPVGEFALSEELKRCVRQIDRVRLDRRTSIVVATRNGIARIESGSILAVRARGHRITICLVGSEVHTGGTLKQYETVLSELGFVRAHHSVLVNSRHIARVSAQDCVLSDGMVVPVSRRRRRELLDAVANGAADLRSTGHDGVEPDWEASVPDRG